MGRDRQMTPLPYESTWPPEWAGRRRSALLLFSAVFIGLLAAGICAGAVAQLAGGDPVSAVIVLAVGIYFGHLAALCLHSYRGGRPRTDTTGVREEPAGLTFRYAALPTYVLGAFLIMTTVALVGMGIASAEQRTAQGYLIAAVVIALAGLMTAFLVVFFKLAPGQVVISPDGIHHRGLTFTHFVPWDAVVDVVALWAHSPVIFIRTIGSTATVTRNYLGRSTPGPRALSPVE